MDINRRDFVALSATTVAAASMPGRLFGNTSEGKSVPWHQKIRRVGQINMTEHDPAVLDVEEWADYWASLQVDVVMVSITGILAFYPSKVPFHKPGKFLNGRDFAGECIAAAKKRNIRVIARMSPDLNWGDALKAHPEWFKRDKQGNPITALEDTRLYETCMFTTYMTEHIPAIMHEVNDRYHIDGIFTNAWPPIGKMPECYCNACKDLPPYDTPAYWDKFNERVLYLWKMWDGIAKEKGPDNLYFGNLGGAINSGPNMKSLEDVVYWYNCDNQGRGGEDEPIWGCTLQGRVCNAIMDGRTSTNVTAAYDTGRPRWRNLHKSTEEAQMWLNETVASGMVPWYHFVGAEKGLGADRRWHEPGSEYYNWLAKHDSHFTNIGSIADIAVVMGQHTQKFYRSKEMGDPMWNIHGIYYALIEGRFVFDFIHEQDLLTDKLKKYKTVILPNIALLSDAECAALIKFSQDGGSIMASFETSLYNELNERRNDFGIASIFDIHATGERSTRVGNGYMGRIEREHPILEGFSGTDWLPGAQWLQPVAPVESPIMTVIPPYVNYPPELAYPPVQKTEIPDVVAKEIGQSRLVYFAGNIESTSWRSGNTDLSRLLQNAIRWVTKGETPVAIEGRGVVESFAWETVAGYAIHLLNYTNPNMFKGWIREYYPIGEQHIAMTVPNGKSISRVELLRAGKDIPFKMVNGKIEFTVPSILDYEVAGLHTN